MRQPPEPATRTVSCPRCGGNSIYGPSNSYRPFCGERCKSMDFGAWASEAFRVPTDTPAENEPFGDPKLH